MAYADINTLYDFETLIFINKHRTKACLFQVYQARAISTLGLEPSSLKFAYLFETQATL